MQIDISFWLGLLASIPIGLGVNLVSPLFSQWLAKRSRFRGAKRSKELREELRRAEFLSADPASLQIELLESVLGIALFIAFMSTVCFLLLAIGTLVPGPRSFVFMPLFAATFGAALVAKECFSALRRSRNVRHIAKYRSEVELQLRELEAADRIEPKP